MTFRHKLLISLSIFFTILALLILQLSRLQTHKNKPYVVCSTSIIADTIYNIGKNHLDIHMLMGPGIDPHLYKPVENDIINIANADIIFYNGLHLEARMTDVLKQIASWKPTIAVTKDIDQSRLIPAQDYENMYDPHVWFDITLWCCVVKTICNSLIELDPKHADAYQENASSYIEKLQQVLATTKKQMLSIPTHKRILITGHDAFSYFGRQYHYQVIGLQGISTESSPGAQDVQELINFICQHAVPAIFIESSIPTKNIQVLQEGVAAQHKHVTLGGELFSDALGPKNSSADTYIKMLLHNVSTIVDSLKSN